MLSDLENEFPLKHNIFAFHDAFAVGDEKVNVWEVNQKESLIKWTNRRMQGAAKIFPLLSDMAFCQFFLRLFAPSAKAQLPVNASWCLQQPSLKKG